MLQCATTELFSTHCSTQTLPPFHLGASLRHRLATQPQTSHSALTSLTTVTAECSRPVGFVARSTGSLCGQKHYALRRLVRLVSEWRQRPVMLGESVGGCARARAHACVGEIKMRSCVLVIMRIPWRRGVPHHAHKITTQIYVANSTPVHHWCCSFICFTFFKGTASTLSPRMQIYLCGSNDRTFCCLLF